MRAESGGTEADGNEVAKRESVQQKRKVGRSGVR